MATDFRGRDSAEWGVKIDLTLDTIQGRVGDLTQSCLCVQRCLYARACTGT